MSKLYNDNSRLRLTFLYTCTLLSLCYSECQIIYFYTGQVIILIDLINVDIMYLLLPID